MNYQMVRTGYTNRELEAMHMDRHQVDDGIHTELLPDNERVSQQSPVTDEEVEYLRKNWERTKPGGDLFNRQARMHASILIVLNNLRQIENSINPSLLVIRGCIRELRQYEVEV